MFLYYVDKTLRMSTLLNIKAQFVICIICVYYFHFIDNLKYLRVLCYDILLIFALIAYRSV